MEVLQSNKFSKASDVWAFGILVYEVMSRGDLPYANFANLADVSEQIKAGYKMSCPEGCRPEVHERVMLPCWETEPSARPGYFTLGETLVDLGAVPARDDFEDISNSRASRSNVATYQQSQAEWVKSFMKENRPLLSPSVFHVHNVLGPKVVAAVRPPFRDYRGEFVQPAESATIGHMVDAVGKPEGLKKLCPRDGKMGCAYVDTLTKRDDVGRADALLSYTWGYKVLSVGSALQRWTKRSRRDPKRTYVWICR